MHRAVHSLYVLTLLLFPQAPPPLQLQRWNLIAQLSLEQQSALLPEVMAIGQPGWENKNTAPGLRLKNISEGMNAPIGIRINLNPAPGYQAQVNVYPETAMLVHLKKKFRVGQPIEIMAATTSLQHATGDMTDLKTGTINYNAKYPANANWHERWVCPNRKYGPEFLVLAEPFRSTKRFIATEDKTKLPCYTIVEGFKDMGTEILDSIGLWGEYLPFMPEMGAQFLACPPIDVSPYSAHPTHVDFIEKVGDLFGINLMSLRTPAHYLALNLFVPAAFPNAMVKQVENAGLRRDIMTRMIHNFYLCILAIRGDMVITVVGYMGGIDLTGRIVVKEGELFIVPARLWIIVNQAGTTITLAF